MFKFFRFKNKEEFDASIDDFVKKAVLEAKKQFLLGCAQDVKNNVYRELLERKDFLNDIIYNKIADYDKKLIILNHDIDELKVKVETILGLLRINK